MSMTSEVGTNRTSRATKLKGRWHHAGGRKSVFKVVLLAILAACAGAFFVPPAGAIPLVVVTVSGPTGNVNIVGATSCTETAVDLGIVGYQLSLAGVAPSPRVYGYGAGWTQVTSQSQLIDTTTDVVTSSTFVPWTWASSTAPAVLPQVNFTIPNFVDHYVMRYNVSSMVNGVATGHVLLSPITTTIFWSPAESQRRPSTQPLATRELRGKPPSPSLRAAALKASRFQSGWVHRFALQR